MPMLKLGERETGNGGTAYVYLLTGRAIRDAEDKPINGREHVSVSVIGDEPPGKPAVFVTVDGWRDRAGSVRGVRKGDYVLAVGALRKREWQERTYYSLDADLVLTNGTAPKVNYSEPPAGDIFDELLPDDDSNAELPF